jgi:hypothetical protein
MAGLEGYTGPTSGRITIGGGREPVVERFTDPPLTRDEAKAVAWFTALSPNEQLREVRRLKWNLEQAREGWDAHRDRARRAESLSARLEAERDARRPDGYELPRAAVELLSVASEWGWSTARCWTLSEDGLTARLKLGITRGDWRFRLAWIVPVNGNGRGARDRAGLARRPGRNWHDAPALKEVLRLLRADPD